MLLGDGLGGSVEDQVFQVADLRQQFEAHEMREAEDRQRPALGICLDLGRLDLGGILQQASMM